MKVKDVYCFECEQHMGEIQVKGDKYYFLCKNCGHTAEGDAIIDESEEDV